MLNTTDTEIAYIYKMEKDSNSIELVQEPVPNSLTVAT